jgi:hypothetical protein
MEQAITEQLIGWSQGQECAKHEMAFCGMCREQQGIKRSADGSVSFGSDCTVKAVANLLGGSYTEAAELMAANGFRPGHGAKASGIEAAFKSAGFTVRPTSYSLIEAMAASQKGRSFYAIGRRGKKAHAWAITGGAAYEPYTVAGGRFTYRIYEVA